MIGSNRIPRVRLHVLLSSLITVSSISLSAETSEGDEMNTVTTDSVLGMFLVTLLALWKPNGLFKSLRLFFTAGWGKEESSVIWQKKPNPCFCIPIPFS